MNFSSRLIVECSYDYATKVRTLFPDQLMSVEVNSVDLSSKEEADALTAQFPKSLRVRTIHCCGTASGDVWYAQIRADLWATELNAANEAGIKRIRSFVAKCKKLGHTISINKSMYANEVNRAVDTI